jgi:predicted RNase H-like HicB family nuclease
MQTSSNVEPAPYRYSIRPEDYEIRAEKTPDGNGYLVTVTEFPEIRHMVMSPGEVAQAARQAIAVACNSRTRNNDEIPEPNALQKAAVDKATALSLAMTECERLKRTNKFYGDSFQDITFEKETARAYYFICSSPTRKARRANPTALLVQISKSDGHVLSASEWQQDEFGFCPRSLRKMERAY